MGKRIFTLLVFILAFWGSCFSQGFNASYWSAYADKMQLNAKDKAEFMAAHKRNNSPAPSSTNTYTQVPFSKYGSNNTYAGPCVNADFEAGNLTGWVSTSGFNPGFNASGCCTVSGGQQKITNGPGLDFYGGFPMVCPGGSYSLRLGDSINGGFADRIEQTFLVSAANANFSYKYAVVLEDPNHPISQQPSFQVEMVDTTGAQVPCTYFYVAAGQNIPGFFNSTTPGVIYKPWTTVLLDLSPYIGQNLTIRFTTFDCSLGGHFGYAYIDGVCQSFVGGGSANVCAGTTNTFCAPGGLASYMWNGPGVTNYIGQCVPVTSAGVYTVQTTLFSNCNGPSFTYTLNTQPSPTAIAGPNQTVCANNNVVNLAGNIAGFTATPQWSSSGSGTFGSTNTIITTYTPSAADISAGTVTLSLTTLNNGLCPPSTSTLQVKILPSPIVKAGNDQTICATSSAVLSGTVNNAGGGIWSGGSGTFTPTNSALTATYTPTAAEITAGSVTLVLTSTGNSVCFAETDTIVITIQTLPLANAGPDYTVCANNNVVALSGTVSGFSSTGQWSTSGSGGFSSTTNLNTNYTPSATDNSAGSVNIILTTTGNGVCPAASDTAKIIITPSPTVSAGPDQLICSITTATLNGSVIGPTSTGSWTTSGDGTFNPNATTLNAGYTPGPNDVAAGTVTLVLTSTGNGNCLPVSDAMVITITKVAVVNAGPGQLLCSNSITLGLNGTVSGGTSTGIWNTTGTGAFNPGNTVLNTGYFISPADINAGTILFTLTSTNNGPCPAVSDSMTVTLFKLATVSAGPNQNLCSIADTISLAGTIAGSTTNGIWTASGTGTFNPSNTSLNTSYSITTADINNGSVTFTLSSTNNGPCPVVTDTVKIKIRKMAVVNAGPDISVCSTSNNTSLTGTVSGGSLTGIWATTGSGTFSPSNTTLNGFYNITTADKNNGTLFLILTSTNNGVCPPAVDSLKLTIIKYPVFALPTSTSVCSNQNPFTVGTTINGGSGFVKWTTSGSGTFNPSDLYNPVDYVMSSADISAGTVTLTLTSINNGPCGNVSSSITVIIRPTPVAGFIPSAYVANLPNDPIKFTNQSSGATSYNWNFGDGASSIVTNPTHNYTAVGFFTITLIATNQYGCSDTARKEIKVITDVQFPNAFTPNTGGPNGGGYIPGDLSNDVFFPYTSGVTEYRLLIFDRFGELIFESQDINVGWDGYFKGKLCQQDAYVWKADIKFFDGRTYNKTGSITLLR